MEKREMIRLSKKMSYILRHGARKLDLDMDASGWLDLESLIYFLNEDPNAKIDIEDIKFVVDNNDKKRFTIKEGKIRANQGHSIDVDLELTLMAPPEVLFHGTGEKTEKQILEQGLKKMGRNHVHLSKDRETAINVGKRHGKPVIFEVAAGIMHQEGFNFFLSENGVWLVDNVPVKYLSVVKREKKKN